MHSKKTAILALVMALALLTLAACTNSPASNDDLTNSVEDNAFEIAITNNCDTEIYGIHQEYYVAQEPIGGGDVTIAEGVPLKAGETIPFTFTSQDFPNDTDISLFEIEIFVILKDKKEQAAQQTVAIDAQFGNVYDISLTGNETDGFSIALSGNKETYNI